MPNAPSATCAWRPWARGYILWEAAGRFRNPPEVASTGMLVIASIGLVINLMAMRLLMAGSSESLNVKGAYLEVWSDMLGSIGVIVGAFVTKLTGWLIVDPSLAVLIGLWVLPRTWTLLREAGNVLILGVPMGIELEEVRAALLAYPGVTGVHDLHVWALGSREPALTAHILVTDGTDAARLRQQVNAMLEEKFEIEHATLQVETGDCGSHACDGPH